jgi:hypothetical protein
VSAGPSPDRWEPEVSIDLGAADAPVAPEGPPPPQERRRWLGLPPGRENLLLAYVAIALVLAAAVVAAVKLSPLNRPLAEETVRAFLEASRDGDVDEALSYTNLSEPVGGFLRPEALDPSWRIVTVAQVDYRDDRGNGTAVAQVYAEIEADEGTRVGYRYRVGIERGRADIENALVAVDTYAAFDHLDINGVSVPVDDETGYMQVMLLPGVYEFYPDLPSTFTTDHDTRMIALGSRFASFGEETSDMWLPVPALEVTEEGKATMDAAIREYYDACAAVPSGEGCPFAFPEDREREVALAPGAVWEVAAYPRVRAQSWMYVIGEGFGLVTIEPGEARAQVVITEDGRERTATVSCPIWTEGLSANFDFEGGATIEEGSFGAEERCRSLTEVH